MLILSNLTEKERNYLYAMASEACGAPKLSFEAFPALKIKFLHQYFRDWQYREPDPRKVKVVQGIMNKVMGK